MQSMTGFGQAQGQLGDTHWVVEARSTNSKGLDLRLRLPGGYETLEADVRRLCASKISRGAVSLSLAIERAAGDQQITINEPVLTRYLSQINALDRAYDLAPSRATDVLALKGVVDVSSPAFDDTTDNTLQERLVQDIAVAVDALVAARRAEGAQLAAVLRTLVDQINDLVEKAVHVADQQPKAIAERLSTRLVELLPSDHPLDQDRLAQEVAYLATKADVREELDRLAAHCVAARDLLATDGPVGRKFDFLTQEFNREANTLCAKAVVDDLSRIGLDLKSAIDQVREQIQNLE